MSSIFRPPAAALGLLFVVLFPAGSEVLVANPPAVSSVRSADVIFEESFEAEGLAGWEVGVADSAGIVKRVQDASFGSFSAELDKPDTSGSVSLQRTVPVVSTGPVVLTADVKTLRAGSYAEYWMEITWLDASGKTIGTPQRMAFDDAMASVITPFGGTHKTPQTLGEWRTTRHLVTRPANASQLRLAITAAGGAQKIRIDNLRVAESSGPNLPAATVFDREIRSPGAARLDLDMLIPGFQYDVQALLDGENTTLVGAAAAFRDRDGKWSDPAPLRILSRGKNSVTFELDMPFRAVAARVDLHTPDMVTHGALHSASKKYRNFTRVTVRPLQTLPAYDAWHQNFVQKVGQDAPEPPFRTDLSDFDRLAVMEMVRARKPENVEAVLHKGGMAIRVGDKLFPPLFACGLFSNHKDIFSELARNGVRFVRFSADRGGAPLSNQWKEDGTFDFSEVDARIYEVLSQAPDALIILNEGGIYPPSWWGDKHPDELLTDHQGQVVSSFDTTAYKRMWGKWNDGELGRIHEAKYAGNEFLANQGAARNTFYIPSPASRAYREAMKTYLTALRRHIESSPYAASVVGYHLWWGEDIQWNWPLNPIRQDLGIKGEKLTQRYGDYSRPMLEWFRAYLREKYKTNEALQAAWKNSSVTFETAEIPAPSVRMPMDSLQGRMRILLDPARERSVLDYNEAHEAVIGDLLNEMAGAIKAAAPRKVLTVAYFQDTMRELGHDRVLASEALDITGGPSYEAREIGQAGLTPHISDSYRLNEKIEIAELDHRLFPAVHGFYRNNQVFDSPRKSISVIQREAGRQMVKGGGLWTLEMAGHWFSHPILAGTLGQAQKVWAGVLETDRSSPARVAVFFSDKKYGASTLGHHYGQAKFLGEVLRTTLPHAGLPIDTFRINDLPEVASRYKVFVFPDIYSLTEKQRQSVESLKKDGNILVFGQAAGFSGETRASDESASSLVGMPLKRDGNLEPVIEVAAVNSPLTARMNGFRIGGFPNSDKVRFPMFHVEESGAEALGHYSGSDKRIGFAIKKHENWTSVFLGAVGIWPPEFFQGLGKLAGLPIYSEDGDAMWIARDLIAVHASTDGLKTIRLPEEAEVTSLWDGKSIGRVKEFSRPMKTGDNALYLLKRKAGGADQ